jgi:hypothetical protein
LKVTTINGLMATFPPVVGLLPGHNPGGCLFVGQGNIAGSVRLLRPALPQYLFDPFKEQAHQEMQLIILLFN